MYGTQTNWNTVDLNALFENDVKMYGTQTTKSAESAEELFENDVKMYGTQTQSNHTPASLCLRMM